ncbi:MAG: hypothetical protein CMH69_03490 [Nitratireductor sp.]|nr:hypothetical protein [Nitratireductor sp.]
MKRKQPPMRQNARKAARSGVSSMGSRQRRNQSGDQSLETGTGHQEIEPNTLRSTPFAISTWLSTGSVGKSRSVIMRT